MPEESSLSLSSRRTPWNKGKLIGAKPPLRPKHVWSIRTRLLVEGRTRDLAMFNLAIDSKLRGCDVVALKVEDVAPKYKVVGRNVVFWELTPYSLRMRSAIALPPAAGGSKISLIPGPSNCDSRAIERSRCRGIEVCCRAGSPSASLAWHA